MVRVFLFTFFLKDTRGVIIDSNRGLGGALALRFGSEGFHVVLLGRRMSSLSDIQKEMNSQGYVATPIACDVSDNKQVEKTFEKISTLGNLECVVFNCGCPMPPGRSWTDRPETHEIDPEYFNRSFDIGVTGCLRVARAAVPRLLKNADLSTTSFLISSATMALRGGAKFGFMAPVKAALRSLSQSMFNEYAPKGLHVSNVVIDGVIDSPATHAWGASVQLMNPLHIADEYIRLHNQKRSVWSWELQIGPNKQSVGMRM